MTHARHALARGRAAFRRGADRVAQWSNRAVRAHPCLAQVPWGALVAAAIAACIARLADLENWLSIGLFAYVNLIFYAAGRLIESRNISTLIGKLRDANGDVLLEMYKLGAAYQHLRMRHLRMTGELFDASVEADAPKGKPYDA